MLLWGIKRSRGHGLEAAAIRAVPQRRAISHPPRGSGWARAPRLESKQLARAARGQTRSPSGQISPGSAPMQHRHDWKVLDLLFRKGALLEEHTELTQQHKQSSDSSPQNTSMCYTGPWQPAPSSCLGKSGFLGDGRGSGGPEPASAAGKALCSPLHALTRFTVISSARDVKLINGTSH